MAYRGKFCIHNILFNLIIKYALAFLAVNLLGAIVFNVLGGTDTADYISTILVAVLRLVMTVVVLVWSVHSSAKYASKKEYAPSRDVMSSFCWTYFGIYAGVQVLYTGYSLWKAYMEVKEELERYQHLLEAYGGSMDISGQLYASLVVAGVAGVLLAGAILYMAPYTLKTYQKYE